MRWECCSPPPLHSSPLLSNASCSPDNCAQPNALKLLEERAEGLRAVKHISSLYLAFFLSSLLRPLAKSTTSLRRRSSSMQRRTTGLISVVSIRRYQLNGGVDKLHILSLWMWRGKETFVQQIFASDEDVRHNVHSCFRPVWTLCGAQKQMFSAPLPHNTHLQPPKMREND